MSISLTLLALGCAGLLGVGVILGLVVLLLKLGVIGQYAFKQEPEEVDAEYSLSQSHEARYEGKSSEE